MNTRNLGVSDVRRFGWLVWVLAQQAGTTALAAILAASWC
jgi:thiol:disulfide interchange protein DsbD